MTYCLSIKLKEGFIGIADTRITSGSATTTARKVFTVNEEKHAFFIMTSGLRSVRDKAITYFNEIIESEDRSFNKLYKAVNAFATQVKRVAAEDKEALTASGLNFNLYSIVGGQLEDDSEHRIYLLYPEGNWIEVSEGSPYVIIGNNGYGKPILDRTITFESSMKLALQAGFLSFDSTRISANDVDFPIDVLYYAKDSFNIIQRRFSHDEMRGISRRWSETLANAVVTLPDEWTSQIIPQGE